MKCTIDELLITIQELEREQKILNDSNIKESIKKIINKLDEKKRLDRDKLIDQFLN